MDEISFYKHSIDLPHQFICNLVNLLRFVAFPVLRVLQKHETEREREKRARDYVEQDTIEIKSTAISERIVFLWLERERETDEKITLFTFFFSPWSGKLHLVTQVIEIFGFRRKIFYFAMNCLVCYPSDNKTEDEVLFC